MVERWIFWLCLIVCVLVSAGGIVFAVVYHSPSDGGRGGAVADTIALFIFFFSRDYGTGVYNILRVSTDLRIFLTKIEKNLAFDSAEARIKNIEEEIKALEAKLKIEASGQRDLNLFIALSAAIGTLTWGFGDILACHLIGNG
jgi:hypothetical protein